MSKVQHKALLCGWKWLFILYSIQSRYVWRPWPSTPDGFQIYPKRYPRCPAVQVYSQNSILRRFDSDCFRCDGWNNPYIIHGSVSCIYVAGILWHRKKQPVGSDGRSSVHCLYCMRYQKTAMKTFARKSVTKGCSSTVLCCRLFLCQYQIIPCDIYMSRFIIALWHTRYYMSQLIIQEWNCYIIAYN